MPPTSEPVNVLRDVNHTALSHAQLRAIESYGTGSYYFLDLDKLRQNYRQLQQAFSDAYTPSQIAYSFKTNYAPMIVQILRSEGCWAEVVSAMEYDIATGMAGFTPEHIIINGPLHGFEFIERAMLDGALFNADAWYLLDLVAEVCRRHPQRRFRIGVRLNYAIAEGGFSRFGIPGDASNLRRLAEWVATVGNCRIAGFHSHFSNSSRSLASFASRVSGLLAASAEFFSPSAPEFINVGGGFFGDMPEQLSRQYAPAPDFRAYANLIGEAMANGFSPADRVTLLLEPGTALVSNAMVFVSKVIEVKQVDGKTIALVDGSNHNIRHKWQAESLPVQIVRAAAATASMGKMCFDVVGNTCIEKDVMRSDVPGAVAAGDYLIFQYMGGYSQGLKQPFIHPCQPVYAWRDGRLMMVKRQETVNDIMATYAVFA